jgi:sigma-B regulation protein RsbU (phosphoserine phosphatase)
MRRSMPWVAAGAAVSIVLGALLEDTRFDGDGYVTNPLRFLAVTTLLLTVFYYGWRAGRWGVRKLLWRVRRRLIITYLFVGLTPILLISLLALIAGFGITAEAMARIVTLQMDSKRRQAADAAAAMARALTTEGRSRDRVRVRGRVSSALELAAAGLPCARAGIWTGQAGFVGFVPDAEPTAIAGGCAEEPSKGPALLSGPLPSWIREKGEWSGVAVIPPGSNPDEFFSAPFLGALARGTFADGSPFFLLLEVPVGRGFVERLRATTGIHVQPYFAGTAAGPVSIRSEEPGKRDGSARPARDGRNQALALDIQTRDGELGERDQLGEPIRSTSYIAIVPAVRWSDGKDLDQVAFLFPWSLEWSLEQILGGSVVGSIWKIALLILGGIFLGFELLALAAAAWMTREVTATVHELHVGTRHVRSGDFSHRIRAVSKDQMGDLATAFNDMSDHIEELMRERVERVRLQGEIEIAARTQARLFPRSVPVLPGAEMTGECRAASGVAGDYYDFVEAAPGRIVLALGDVAGKGLPASLLMSTLQGCLRAQTALLPDRPSGARDGEVTAAQFTRSVNLQLCRNTDANRYATLFLAVYDDARRSLLYTNAGHNPALLVQPDGFVRRLTEGGTIIGAFESARYEEETILLVPGSVLVAFSDGISEARNPADEEYGEARLARFVSERRELSAEDLRRAVFEEVDAWAAGRERGDDQTLLILKTRTAGFERRPDPDPPADSG